MTYNPISVTELNRYIKNKIAEDEVLSNVLVKGEISNFKEHSSGHLYFTLKDARAAIQCMMFAADAAALPFSKIRTLVTICSSARFPSDPMWPGMDHTLVLKCRQLLDPRRCGRLLRFFAKYQIAANLNHNHEQEFFLSMINDGVIPDYQVLMSGIDLMAYSDVREALKNLNIPCMFLFGAKDVLVPASLAFTPLYSSLSNNKGSEIFIFPDSAHVPFLTEPNLFKEKLLNFYDRVNTFFNFRA